MKREWLLLLGSTAVTVLLALGMIRWLAPGMLGISPDLQLVRVDEALPPFFENVFRSADLDSEDFLLQDPISIQRAKPLFADLYGMGPHDLLGFRNRSIPNVVDIVTIGDSQTYGNNAPLELNWPSRLRAHLEQKRPTVYNMSCGAWNGPQYLYMLKKAARFRPRVVVVAFYSGNDPLGAFAAAYGTEHWADLRPDDSLTADDAPRVDFPPPESTLWRVSFRDGTSTVMTPLLRLASNLLDDRAVQTGWDILAKVGERIDTLGRTQRIAIVFTVIPTKELVYAARVLAEGIPTPPEYSELTESEAQNIARLSAALDALPSSHYVDLVQPLQRAAQTALLYPPNRNGHPIAGGYDVISRAVAAAVEQNLPDPPSGLVFVSEPADNQAPMLVRDGKKWIFTSHELWKENGWELSMGRFVTERDVAGLEYAGYISRVDPGLYGPQGPRYQGGS